LKLFKSERTFLFFLIAGLIFITGCSSSTNSIRYGSKSEGKEEKENPVRYGNKSDKVVPSGTEEEHDETPDNLTSVDASILSNKYNSSDWNSGVASDVATLRETMLMEIIRYMNTPYKFGGNSKEGIDCSAFTQTIYGSCSLQLLRTAREQYNQGIPVENREDLKFGDLIFFNTRKNVRPGHVGIYLGDNLFVHASSKHGVIVTPLSHEYYSKRYMGARRIEEIMSLQ
jgi:cell wall-associated NlpC family hydrolase